MWVTGGDIGHVMWSCARAKSTKQWICSWIRWGSCGYSHVVSTLAGDNRVDASGTLLIVVSSATELSTRVHREPAVYPIPFGVLCTLQRLAAPVVAIVGGP